MENIHYEVTPAIQDALKDFFDRMDGDTMRRILAETYGGAEFSEVEIEIKQDLIYQFYYHRLLPADRELHGIE